MKRLNHRVIPKGEIEAGRLVRVHVYDSKTKYPVCSEPNPLKVDLWILITDNGLNDIPDKPLPVYDPRDPEREVCCRDAGPGLV